MSTAPVQDDLVRFQKSGGSANTDQHLSLGGNASNESNGAIRFFTSNTLHNVFDEVQISESLSGDREYRHMYYRNSHSFKVRNAKLWVIADQTSVWSKIEVAKGTANNGFTEQTTANENLPPSGIVDADWKVPTLSDPLVLGDVDAGQVASIWLRRTIPPGALIVRNEKFHIRIQADPPVPVGPPITCPDGQHFDNTTGTCVDDEDPDDPGSGVPCEPGTHLENGQCVPDGSPPIPQPIQIVIAGDTSCNDEGLRTIRMAGEMLFNDLFIHVGDLSYTSSRNCITDAIEDYPTKFGGPLRNRTKIAIGNHDDEEEQSTTLRNSYISYFGIPSQGYYSFNIQNIHVLIMDTQSSYASNSAQFNFVRSDLTAASQQANIDWIIVCYHKPSMTLPSDHDPLTDFRDTYHPMFDQFKVDLVVAGHNHNMQRTHPVRYNAASPSNPTVVTSNANHTYTNVDGRIFIVIGSGGRALDDVGNRTAEWAFSNAEDNGVLLLRFQNNNKTLDGRFVSNGDVEADLEDLDIFVLNKTN